MIKIGDKVKFLNTVGGGVVTGFAGKNIANVEDEQGFEVPTLISQLVPVNDGQDETVKEENKTQIDSVVKEKKATETAERIIIESTEIPTFLLAFVPENVSNPVDGDMKTYLVNSSKFSLLFNYSYWKDGEYVSQLSGKLDPGTKLLLDHFSSAELNNLPDFFFQFLFFQTKSAGIEMPLFKMIKVNPVKFYKEKSFTRNSYFTENAYLIPIQNSDFEDQLKEITDKEIKKAIREKQEPKAKKTMIEKADLVEVDLHIHQLLDDTRGLSNHEMMEIQMNTFHEKLEEAVKSGVKKIVFIHGLGNGTLKAEIRRELSQKFKKYAFQDASFQEYGFGATMVILKK